MNPPTVLHLSSLPGDWAARPAPVLVMAPLGKDKALGGKNVSVSDVVDQFGAGGFGVMTSGLIDATLYDKVEQIANNRSIDRDWWDQLRLERFLAENTDIKNRYFDGSGEPQNTWQRSQH